jgi:NADH-quinone oxidoreductase subunit G
MDDVAKDPVLNVSERGDRAYIGIDPDHELTHMWSGNVVDLCPVGSLISKDFLHKARAWDLDKTASICPGCSQGCNMMIDTRDNTVVRLRPRPNLEVNRHFMCDYGRANYRWMNRGDRIEAPLVRDGIKHQAVDWDTALSRLAQAVSAASGSAVLLAGGSTSTEDLAFVKQLLDGLKLTAAARVPLSDEEHPLPGIPNLALRKERAANGEGARLLGYGTDNFAGAVEKAEKASLVVLLNLDLTEAEAARLANHANLVVIGTVATELERNAQIVLPMTNMAEENGTFVNRDLRVQRYSQARMARGMARPAWWIAAEAMSHLKPGYQGPGSASEAFDMLAESVGSFGGMRFRELGLTGRKASPAPVAEVVR